MRWTLVSLGSLAALLALAGLAAACDGLSPGDQIENPQQSIVCTLAFLVANKDGLYFATAGHCGRVNETASNPAALDHDGLGDIGTFAFHHLVPEDGGPSGEAAGAPGDDFALIRIDPALYSTLNPKVCEIDGPTGIYSDTPGSGGVQHYGYGTGLGELPQTRPRTGVGLTNDNVSFYWTGAGVPGDSGSAVVADDGRALGVLTHLTPGAVPQDNGGTHILRGFELAQKEGGFAPLRLVLKGEDPVKVLAQMRAQPPTPVAVTPAANGTAPRPTTAPPPDNNTAPVASGSTNGTVAADNTSPRGEPVVPAASADAPKKTPFPFVATVALVAALALARRKG